MYYLFIFVAFMTFFGLPLLALPVGFFIASRSDQKSTKPTASTARLGD
jgi:hypothetical protein